MGDLLQPLDLILFFAALIVVMAIGLIAGRKEETSEDYFLAGRKIPWWGVAGSIFGSNVSANHMVGMMGIGFSIGFAQSHFELGAIAGLMVLCYGFLPVYRKLNVFTLSEYLRQRYDQRSQISYAVIMVIIMAVVQMVPGLYIGARSICVLLGGDAVQQASVDASEEDSQAVTKHHVNHGYYTGFVIALAVISASYTIFGGLKAVVWTDVIQSVLLLAAGLLVAFLVFREIGGWSAMMAADRAGGEKMHLYLPMNHAELPWTGVFTGLMAMHCFYWGTNQFIVQRALAARSDTEARLGIIVAGFLKLLIPFFAIAAGVAAFYLFKERLDREIAPDTAFTEVVRLVVPTGFGIVGLIAAGLIGAILSSIDSMMNSAATIVTIDIYKRYINPAADDRQMILIGRLSIVVFVVLAALMAIFILDPNSEKNFFLQIVDYQNYLTPGILVAFVLGMLWKRGTATAAFVTIVSGVFFSWLIGYLYNHYLGTDPRVAEFFGTKLNFFHRVVGVILLCCVIHVVVSLLTAKDEVKSRLVWTELGGHKPGTLRNIFLALLGSICFFAILAGVMVAGTNPAICAVVGVLWTLGMFAGAIKLYPRKDASHWLLDDRSWAGLLCSLAVFMMYYFY
ncbi:MAG: sodium/solute symporter [Planctomycetota bacterium]|nr:sodium/solute symporter [Planctomycetota bacterium]